MDLLDHTLEIENDSATAGHHRALAGRVHSFLDRHWVTVITLLVVAVTLAVSMHFPVYTGVLHGHPGR